MPVHISIMAFRSLQRIPLTGQSCETFVRLNSAVLLDGFDWIRTIKRGKSKRQDYWSLLMGTGGCENHLDFLEWTQAKT